MSDTGLRELIIPPKVLTAGNTQEFIRFWVADGEDHVSLNIGGFVENDREAYNWGSILADIAWHAVNGMQQDDCSRGTASEMLDEIKRGFEDRLIEKPTISGTIRGKRHAH